MGCVQGSTHKKQAYQSNQVKELRRIEIQRMKKQLNKKQRQITLLEKQNDQLKKKKNNPVENIEPNNISEVEIIQFQQDGKIEQSKQDADNELRQLLKCTLCQQDYNLKIKIPLMVCVNQHTYCNDCISRMLQRNQNKCPQCRQAITAGNRNLHLCLLLQNINKKDNNNNTSLKKNNTYKQLNISVNPNNKYNSQYKFFPPNTIIKGDKHKWFGLQFNQVIPAEGKFKFCIEVVFSIHNNIQIGLIDLYSKVQQGKMSNKRITFHLYDGKVMDSGSVDVPITQWRPLGIPVPKGQACKIIVDINMDDNQIKWIVNDKVCAQTVITNFVKYAKAVPYLSMYHIDDIVNINAW